MDDTPRWTVIAVAGMIGLSLIAFLLTLILTLGGGSELTPRTAFEAHIAALDAGEWALSDTYTKAECTIAATGSAETLQEVIDGGFSYRRTFQIEDVWINEAGDEAILELNTPSELPQVAVLDLVEGEWLVTC